MSAIRLQDAIGEIQDCYIAEARTSRIRSRKWIAILLAAILIALGLIACAPILFNSLSDDDLAFHSAYRGNGIIEINVENKSDKTLHFQKKVKLERWSDGQEIPAHGEVIFTETTIPVHSIGTMTIDLSRAYDLTELEKPLSNDHYYLILTNNNFVFGQDWMCSVSFVEKTIDEIVYPEPISPAEADPKLAQQVETDLQDFFGKTLLETDRRAEVTSAYYESCAKLIHNSEKTVIHPVSPAPYFLYDDPPEGTIFDSNLPEDVQYQLIGIHESSVDDYFFPVGASGEDTAKVFSVIIPQSQADCFRVQGDAIKIGYVMIYDTQESQIPDAYTLIHGQLIPISDLTSHIVYEDSQYIAYNVTDYFFTDIDTHIAAFRAWRTDLFDNEDVQRRIENVYQYLQNGGIKMHLYSE
ncbi:MAG: hypothetical protein Q4F81_02575 [Eubacteriales bacterium]|nr:hypothetical protein [Eubacteriales bacterium]